MPSESHRATPPASLASPRFGALWAALVYVAATIPLCYPAFGGGYLAGQHSDQLRGGYAVRELATAMLRHTGHIPLWNPYLFGGMPFVGAVNGDLFYPPSLVMRLLLRQDVFMTWAFILHIFLCGWLTYLFMRGAGLSFAGALIAGLAYMMGGPISSYVSPGHDGKLYVSALLPLALVWLTFGMRDGRRWAWPALALTVGFAVLSPHPQLLQYMLLACGAYALYLAFWQGPGVSPARPIALRRLGTALGAVVLGLMTGAIQFLPVAQYAAFSPRAEAGVGGHGYDWAVSYSMPPEELFNTYLPQFSGLLDRYWGRNGIHFHSEYLGVVVLLLAGCAFVGTRPERRRNIRYWLVVAVVATIWSFGGFTPLYHLIYVLVPGTKFFRAPGTMFFLAALAVAILAGEGAENVLRRAVRMRYVIAWSIAAAFVALLAVSGVLTTLSAGIALPEAADLVQANASDLSWGAARCLILVLAAAGVLALVRDDKVKPRVAVWVLAGLVAVDLWSIERLYWQFSPPASVVYAPDSGVAYLQRQSEPGRVLAAPTQATGIVGNDPELLGDALMIHRVRLDFGYHGNQIHRYDVLQGREGDAYRGELSPQIWRLLNVRYLLTNGGDLGKQGLQLLVGPFRDASGSTLYLYRLPGDNPAAWVTPVSVKVGDAQALATVTDQRFDPTLAAVYDSAAPVEAQQVDKLPASLGIGVAVTRYDPGHMSFKLDRPAPAGASLIASENYYPGWVATVDGKPAVAARADYTLIGVPLVAGATTVDLTFTSHVYEVGKTITLCAVVLMLGWLAAAILLSRRRHG